jgi:hypothetical protein
MSDRVGYMVGNTKGRDHIMWPVVNGPLVDADQIYTVNLATLMQMAWRVREWRVTAGTMAYDWPFSGSGPPDIHLRMAWSAFSLKMQRYDIGEVMTEKDILGPSSSYLGYGTDKTLGNLGVSGADNSPVITVNGSADGPGSANGNIDGTQNILYDSVRNLFGPPLGLSGSAYAFSTNVIISFGSASASFLAAHPTQNAVGTVTVVDPAGGPGLVSGISIQGYSVGSPLNGTGTVSNIAVTPIVWWPHKNRLGLPVYDTSSGAQINDPFA